MSYGSQTATNCNLLATGEKSHNILANTNDFSDIIKIFLWPLKDSLEQIQTHKSL